MSSHEWKVLYSTIKQVHKSIPRTGRRTLYPAALIVALYFWSVLHDRPLCWATQRKHYTSLFRPRRLPSRSQFCRRIRTPRGEALVAAVQQRRAQSTAATPFMFWDGRAFPVGPDTTDPDARAGRRSGGFARGYKLHALVTEDGRFPQIRVTALNVCAKRMARELVAQATLGGVVLADGNYDDKRLYDAVSQRGALLFTPLPRNAGQGQHYQAWSRLLAARLWADGTPPFYERRRAVERYFGQFSGFGGGLAPLPAWVRTLPRVRRWITAKVAIYQARLVARRAAC